MIRSVVKHSYCGGGKRGKARAKAHLGYLAFRPGEDRPRVSPKDRDNIESEKKELIDRPGEGQTSGPRAFYNKDRDNIPLSEIKKLIDRQTDPNVTMHKLILSPGMNTVDLKEYTREVMEGFGRSKGLDLEWTSTDHLNTDHYHSHVEIMGVDKKGHQVRIKGKDDYELLRELGDRYLDRTRPYERYLERDIKDMMRRTDHNRTVGDDAYNMLIRRSFGPERELLDKDSYERKGPEDYRSLFGKLEEPGDWDKAKAIEALRSDDKIRANDQVYTKFSSREDLIKLDLFLNTDPENRISLEKYQQLWGWIGTKERNGDDFYELEAKKSWDSHREWKQFDEDLRKGFESGEIPRSRPMGRQASIEAAGRLGEEHAAYGLGDARQYIKNIVKNDPSRKSEFEESLAYYDALEQQMKDDRRINEPLSSILMLDLGDETRGQRDTRIEDRNKQREIDGDMPTVQEPPRIQQDIVWNVVTGFDQTKNMNQRQEEEREEREDMAP